jgi:hypothetical protein
MLRPRACGAAGRGDRRGDALAIDWSGRAFDVVIGNPPFRNQLAAATSRGGRSRFGGGPYADTAAEFLALAMRLAPARRRSGRARAAAVDHDHTPTPPRPGGRRGTRGTRVDVVVADVMFDASVRTCVLVFELGAPAGVEVARTFGAEFAPASSVDARRVVGPAALALFVTGPAARWCDARDIGSFTVDFRDPYYGLIGAGERRRRRPAADHERPDRPGRLPLGERPVRFAKQRYAAPARSYLSTLTDRSGR